jgi:hypothetical protein
VREDYQPRHCWAEIEPLEVPTRLPFGKPTAARFRVHNRSDYPWCFNSSPNAGVHLRYVLYTPDKSFATNGGAGYFDAVLPPGASMDLTLSLPALQKPGRYLLRVDMADEQRCWFFMVGSPYFETEVEVAGKRTTSSERTQPPQEMGPVDAPGGR